eukprot:scaffold27212_cov91-Isochrysis_galbana.AAC.2
MGSCQCSMACASAAAASAAGGMTPAPSVPQPACLYSRGALVRFRMTSRGERVTRRDEPMGCGRWHARAPTGRKRGAPPIVAGSIRMASCG